MVKFYKPGKIVVVLNGRFAGRKGVIVKSNYESVKDRKYPHCMVVTFCTVQASFTAGASLVTKHELWAFRLGSCGM